MRRRSQEKFLVRELTQTGGLSYTSPRRADPRHIFRRGMPALYGLRWDFAAARKVTKLLPSTMNRLRIRDTGSTYPLTLVLRSFPCCQRSHQ